MLVRAAISWHTIAGEGILMTIFNEPRGHVIDANSGSVLRLFGIAAAAFVGVAAISSRGTPSPAAAAGVNAPKIGTPTIIIGKP